METLLGIIITAAILIPSIYIWARKRINPILEKVYTRQLKEMILRATLASAWSELQRAKEQIFHLPTINQIGIELEILALQEQIENLATEIESMHANQRDEQDISENFPIEVELTKEEKEKWHPDEYNAS